MTKDTQKLRDFAGNRDRSSLMIGVFGQREMELAAVKIVHHRWSAPLEPFDPVILRLDDGYEKDGLKDLVAHGWLTEAGGKVRPTPNFWQRIVDRI